jgi:hypothetical protein
VQLRHESAAQADAYRVPTGIARRGPNRRGVIVFRYGMVIASVLSRMVVVVRGRPVVVVRMIVADVLVHVQRGPYGG